MIVVAVAVFVNLASVTDRQTDGQTDLPQYLTIKCRAMLNKNQNRHQPINLNNENNPFIPSPCLSVYWNA